MSKAQQAMAEAMVKVLEECTQHVKDTHFPTDGAVAQADPTPACQVICEQLAILELAKVLECGPQ